MNEMLRSFFSKIDYILRTENVKFTFTSLIVIMIIASAALSLSIFETSYRYSIGDIATGDIRVSRTINDVNESETENEKQRALETVKIVFDKDVYVLIDTIQQVQRLFESVRQVLRDNPPIGTETFAQQLEALKKKLPPSTRADDALLLELLELKDLDPLYRAINRIVIYIYDNNEMGLLGAKYANPLNIPNTNIVIRNVASVEAEEVTRTVSQLKTLDEIQGRLYNISYSLAPQLPAHELRMAVKIIRAGLRPNLRFNQDETQRRIDLKLHEVKPVMGTLKKGQTIVREGDTVTGEIMNKIAIINRNAAATNYYYVIGVVLIQLVFFILFGYFALEYRHYLIPDSRAPRIIFSLVLLFIAYAFALSRSEAVMGSKIIFALFLPIPFVTMILTILYNIYIAFVVSVYLIFFTAVISGGELATVILAFSSAALGLVVNSRVERRTDFLRGGLILGVANAVIVVSVVLIEQLPGGSLVKNVQLALANGIINSILVMGLLPLYENIFDVTTRFKLLELSDLNANIFKKMLVKAPGTYHHSLIVSTMAEAACKDIRANAMLARVGAFYHDIGKIEDSGMYIENKVTDPRANSISSKGYSRLIISHVSKGVEMGRNSGLPESIIDFIREHHGRSTLTYFYHQALEEASAIEETEEIKRSDFQYPGPKPHSRETAIVMLADAVEAASRTIQDPTEAKLEGLVRKIVYNKLNEGELEYSDLSMSQLTRIQKSFLSILNGIFHTRIEYPDNEEIQTLEKRVQKLRKADD
jgi:putative nucleotidyltransferase with HDIG domain